MRCGQGLHRLTVADNSHTPAGKARCRTASTFGTFFQAFGVRRKSYVGASTQSACATAMAYLILSGTRALGSETAHVVDATLYGSPNITGWIVSWSAEIAHGTTYDHRAVRHSALPHSGGSRMYSPSSNNCRARPIQSTRHSEPMSEHMRAISAVRFNSSPK